MRMRARWRWRAPGARVLPVTAVDSLQVDRMTTGSTTHVNCQCRSLLLSFSLHIATRSMQASTVATRKQDQLAWLRTSTGIDPVNWVASASGAGRSTPLLHKSMPLGYYYLGP